MDTIEPTDDERRNGWTAESLTRYISEQQRSQRDRIDHNAKPQNPTRTDSRYNPLEW